MSEGDERKELLTATVSADGGPPDNAGCALSIRNWTPPTAARQIAALVMEISDTRINVPRMPRWEFTIPGGQLHGIRDCYTMRIISPVPAPGRWVRFWSRLLLGWTWKEHPDA